MRPGAFLCVCAVLVASVAVLCSLYGGALDFRGVSGQSASAVPPSSSSLTPAARPAEENNNNNRQEVSPQAEAAPDTTAAAKQRQQQKQAISRRLSSGALLQTRVWPTRPSDMQSSEYALLEAHFTREIVRAGVPVLISGAPPAKQWAALEAWKSADAMRSRLPNTLAEVCSRDHARQDETAAPATSDRVFFYFQSSYPLAAGGAATFAQPYNVTDVDRDGFLSVWRDGRTAGGGGGRSVYYSRPFNWVSPQKPALDRLWSEIQPISALAGLSPDVGGPEDDYVSLDRVSSVNFWMASAGATARLHYDSSHNFFAQVHGVKRFTLVSPNDASALSLYPRLHPAHRQSQVPVERFLVGEETEEDRAVHGKFVGRLENGQKRKNEPAPEEVKTETKTKTKKNKRTKKKSARRPLDAVTVDLGPGDVLYIPPFHFHHVEALSPVVSVNIYRESEQAAAIRTLFNSPLPIRGDWFPVKKVAGLEVFLLSFLRAYLSGRDTAAPAVAHSGSRADEIERAKHKLNQRLRSFVRGFVFDRYAPLSTDSLLSYADSAAWSENEEDDSVWSLPWTVPSFLVGDNKEGGVSDLIKRLRRGAKGSDADSKLRLYDIHVHALENRDVLSTKERRRIGRAGREAARQLSASPSPSSSGPAIRPEVASMIAADFVEELTFLVTGVSHVSFFLLACLCPAAYEPMYETVN